MRKGWYKKARQQMAAALMVTMIAGTMPVNVFASASTMSPDGKTFTNPVINMDVADPDAIYANGAYYMVSTTMHMSPGVPILRSYDMVNWETVNYVYDTMETDDAMSLRNGDSAYGRGSWAASLRYREDNGKYYVTFASLTTGKTYVYSTDNIETGPWVKSVLPQYLHDLSLMIEESDSGDTKMCLLWCDGENKGSGKNGGDGNGNKIAIVELKENGDGTVEFDPDQVGADGLLDESKRQYILPKGSNVVHAYDTLSGEGIHAYKIGDYYYLLSCQWPGAQDWTNYVNSKFSGNEAVKAEMLKMSGGKKIEVCWRSKELMNPDAWEGQVILNASMEGYGAGIAQGNLMQAENGDWYSILFQDRGSIGRVPVLVPVVWTRIDADGTRHAGGEPGKDWPMLGNIYGSAVPASAAMPTGEGSELSPVMSDEFYQGDGRLIFTAADLDNPGTAYRLAESLAEEVRGNVFVASKRNTKKKKTEKAEEEEVTSSDTEEEEEEAEIELFNDIQELLGTKSNWRAVKRTKVASDSDWEMENDISEDVDIATASNALAAKKTISLRAGSFDGGLIENGDMEDTGSDAWMVAGNNGDKGYYSETQAHSGTNSYYVTNRDGAWIGAGQQGISLEKGREYTLSAWIYSESEKESPQFKFNFEIEPGTSAVTVEGAVTPKKWSEITKTFTAEEDYDDLTLWVQTNIDGDTAAYYLDDVSLKAGEKEKSVQPAGDSLVINGSFDSGKTEPWKIFDTENGASLTPTADGSGYYMSVHRTDTWIGIGQGIDASLLEAGQRYRLSLRAKLPEGSENAGISAILENGGKEPAFDVVEIKAGSWQDIETEVSLPRDWKAQGNEVNLWIRTTGNARDYMVDDISLIPVYGEAEDNVIDNGSFEGGTAAPWDMNAGADQGARAEVSREQAASGVYSLKAVGRTGDDSGPRQNISGKMKVGDTYTFSAKVYNPSSKERSFNLTIQMGEDYRYRNIMGSTGVAPGTWGTIEGEYTVPDRKDGLSVDMDHDNAAIFFETPWSTNDTEDFYIDDVLIVKNADKEQPQIGEHDYNGSNLGLQWQWNHNPNNNNWSLLARPGYLRLTTGHLTEDLERARNTLTQRTYGPTCSGQVAMEVAGMKNGDVAGLAAFQYNYGYVAVRMENDKKYLVMEQTDNRKDQPENNGDKIKTPAKIRQEEKIELNQDRVYLRVDFDFEANTAHFYYSLDDETWNPIGGRLENMSFNLSHFIGYRFALFNYATRTTGGYVDFDYFHVDDDNEKENNGKLVSFGAKELSVAGIQNTEFELPLKLEALAPEGRPTGLEAVIQLPEYLDVADVVFNTNGIRGTASWSVNGARCLVLRVSGEPIGYSDSNNLFATLKLRVNTYVQQSTSQTIRVDSVKVAGAADVYSVKNGAAVITLSAGSMAATGKQIGEGNPLITHKFGADPFALVYNGRVYIYMSSDAYMYKEDGSIKENDYDNIHSISVISSSDLVNWRDEGEVPVTDLSGWAGHSWAPAAAHKVINGQDKFFLYFSDGAGGIGVLTADSPTGPWRDPINRPLIAPNTQASQGVSWLFDPAVLVEEDGSAYLYYGGGVPDETNDSYLNPGTARAIRLGSDMISTVGDAVVIDAPRMLEDSGIHKYNNTYYYSYCTNFVNWDKPAPEGYPKAGVICYMTSDSPMGPFTYQGEVLENPGSVFSAGGNNHHAFFEFNGQWYVTYHAQTLGIALGTPHGYRSPHLGKVSYAGDGRIKPVEINKKGVNQTISLNPFARTEAETIAWQSGVSVKSAGTVETELTVKEQYERTGVLPSLSGHYQDQFKVGVAMNGGVDVRDTDRSALIAEQFNSITCENEMKPDSLLDREAMVKRGMPAVSLENAKPILNFARDRGMAVRGHTLIWHSQTPRWLFAENYSQDPNAPLVGREMMLQRMESYIRAVMEAVNGQYPGLVREWDVVNEAILPQDGQAEGLRTGESLWYQTIGADYVEKAFEFARKYAAPDQRLFYNDYNTYEGEKLDEIYRLAERLKAKGLIDGIGMQSHIGLENPTIKSYENTVRRLGSLGLEIQVTELDVDVKSQADAGAKLAQRYSDVVGLLTRLDREGAADISGITFWGLSDDGSWLNNGNGRRYPLLFDDYEKPKDAYFALVPGTIVTSREQLALTGIHDGDWVSVSSADFKTGGASAFYGTVQGKAGGTITIHLDRPDGKVAGTMTVEAGSGWKELSCDVTGVANTHNVFFVFHGDGEEELFEIDSWYFDGDGAGEVTYKVVYRDWNGKVLKTEKVKAGGNSTPPVPPSRDGYEFVGWTGGTYTDVDSDRTLTAQYKKSTSEPGAQEADTLREILDELNRMDENASPEQVMREVEKQIANVAKVQLEGSEENETVWDLMEQIEERAARLMKVSVPEPRNHFDKVKVTGVVGALFSLPAGGSGYLDVSRVAAPSGIREISNVSCFRISVRDEAGREYPRKTQVRIFFEIPADIDLSQKIVVLDAATRTPLSFTRMGAGRAAGMSNGQIAVTVPLQTERLLVANAGLVSGSTGSSGSGGSGGSGGGGGGKGLVSGGAGTIVTDPKRGQVHSVKGILTGANNESAGDGYSHWQQDARGWRLQYADGSYVAGSMRTDSSGTAQEYVAWELINGAWFAFGFDGYAVSGWVLDRGLNAWYYVDINAGMQSGWHWDEKDKRWYYLNPSGGAMLVGWQQIGGVWYYFSTEPGGEEHPYGSLYQNEMTPDGYPVRADGVWQDKE